MNPIPFDDPLWPRAHAWLAGAGAEHRLGRLAVLGAPLRLGSITPGRCDLAPAAVREGLRRFSCYDIEADTDLHLIEARDLGDLPLADLRLEDAFLPLSRAVRNAIGGAEAVVIIGGDNGVTRPGVHGLSDQLTDCGLITLDAHLDLRDLTRGLTNGNPVRALLADGLPGSNIVQIGLQPFANSRAYAEVAREAGITVVTIDQVHAHSLETHLNEALEDLSERVASIYVDLDLDVLDRIYAPATPGSRPGGLTPWELRRAAWICGAHPKVRALDLVEVDPEHDIAGSTVLTTGACLLSFASGLVTRLTVRKDLND
ncbi:MAG TPA: arginase family protein [Blastocatellia bacterium]|nr:arginase family protein [Blastocatellia bacterium]